MIINGWQRQDKAGTPFQKYLNSMGFLSCKSSALGTAQGLLPLSLLTHGVHSPTDNLSLSHFTSGMQNIQTFWKKPPKPKHPKENFLCLLQDQWWAQQQLVMDNFDPALPTFALGSIQYFLTHAAGMKDPFPTFCAPGIIFHWSIHK